jgi:hypothetical protein
MYMAHLPGLKAPGPGVHPAATSPPSANYGDYPECKGAKAGLRRPSAAPAVQPTPRFGGGGVDKSQAPG